MLITLITAGVSLQAHDSPEHVIELLTARIDAAGANPDLLWRRATEYRAMGRLAAAAKDLRQALKLDPGSFSALADLSRVLAAQGRRRQAMATINRAIERIPEEANRASLRMIRAGILCDAGEFAKAVEDCDRALQQPPGTDPEWYLTRSQIQCRLGRFAEAIAGLKQGYDRTGCAVLEVECIDAQIDAGLFAEAMEKIEPTIADCRWQSSWLIRRARVRLGRGEISLAQADLLTAIRELNLRLQGLRPECGLLSDRGFAYALLGDTSLARRDLSAAKKLGADIWTLRRLEVALH